MTEATLQNVPLDLTTLKANFSTLPGIDFTGCNLTGADFSASTLANVKFVNANLTGANLNGLDLTTVEFTRATMSGAKVQSSNLTGRDLSTVTAVTPPSHPRTRHVERYYVRARSKRVFSAGTGRPSK